MLQLRSPFKQRGVVTVRHDCALGFTLTTARHLSPLLYYPTTAVRTHCHHHRSRTCVVSASPRTWPLSTPCAARTRSQFGSRWTATPWAMRPWPRYWHPTKSLFAHAYTHSLTHSLSLTHTHSVTHSRPLHSPLKGFANPIDSVRLCGLGAESGGGERGGRANITHALTCAQSALGGPLRSGW